MATRTISKALTTAFLVNFYALFGCLLFNALADPEGRIPPWFLAWLFATVLIAAFIGICHVHTQAGVYSERTKQ